MISLRGGAGVFPASSSADVGCSITQVLQILFGRPVCYVQRNNGRYNQATIVLVEDIPLCLQYFLFPGTTQPIADVYFTALYRALASSRTRLLDHIQRRATVGRTPLNQ